MRTRRRLLCLLLWVMPLAAQIKPLTILHSNDLHAHLLPDDRDNGGFARLTTEVRRQKAHCAACLYLNAGDLAQGTPVSTLFHGAPIYRIANLLGIDVSTLGNHEFDYGWRRVQEFFHIASFPIVSANIVDADGKTMTRPYVIQTVGGIRVGVIGAILGDLVGTVITKESAGPWHTLPVVETVRKYAAELRDRTDLIVVLGHIHDETEVNQILKQVPGVSVVVAGHSHEGYPAMVNVDGRVAVLVRSNGAQLGRLDLKVDVGAKKVLSAEWTRIPIDARIPPAPDVAREVARWESKVSRLVDVPIGESTARMEPNNPELRKMIERAMAEQSGADIAWINPGNVRDTMPEGRILARNVWNILPFDNYIVLGKFKGSQLPPSITNRYPVEAGRDYTVATSDFTAANQSARDQLNATGMRFPQTGPLQRDALIEWIKKKKVVP
ncbi:MAG: bifunctional metallophosphatase/5'-nucleotidase [Acidobacteriota bacterium]|nr:bifunctional metallophosphatase/5'-nucleotidase [Acidobacteriota bacterium]